MKKVFLFAVLLLFGATVFAQKELPSVKVESLNGEMMNIRDILSDSIPVVLSFWSTTCKPCITELDAYADTDRKSVV